MQSKQAASFIDLVRQLSLISNKVPLVNGI